MSVMIESRWHLRLLTRRAGVAGGQLVGNQPPFHRRPSHPSGLAQNVGARDVGRPSVQPGRRRMRSSPGRYRRPPAPPAAAGAAALRPRLARTGLRLAWSDGPGPGRAHPRRRRGAGGRAGDGGFKFGASRRLKVPRTAAGYKKSHPDQTPAPGTGHYYLRGPSPSGYGSDCRPVSVTFLWMARGVCRPVLLSSKFGLVKISRARAKSCNSIVEP